MTAATNSPHRERHYVPRKRDACMRVCAVDGHNVKAHLMVIDSDVSLTSKCTIFLKIPMWIYTKKEASVDDIHDIILWQR